MRSGLPHAADERGRAAASTTTEAETAACTGIKGLKKHERARMRATEGRRTAVVPVPVLVALVVGVVEVVGPGEKRDRVRDRVRD